MFAARFGFYPPEKITVLAGAVSGSESFDGRQKYPVKRIPLRWTGPRGFEWASVSWQLFRRALLPVLKGVAVVECARPIPEGFAGYLLSFLPGKKLVVNFHGEDISVLRQYRVERWLLKRIIRKAALNLANSRFTEKLVQALGGPGAKTAVVHPGFTPAHLRLPDPSRIEALRARWGEGPILVTVGRIQQRKGQDNVIRALPNLVQRFPGLVYLMIGSSQGGTEGLAAELASLARELGIEKHVAMVGETADAELQDYYAFCDVFLMPNREVGAGDVEGFGIVFLEAGWMGKPVVGGRSGGVPDAVKDGETGLLVDGASVPDIEAAIAKLLSDPAMAKAMGTQGRRFAETMTDAGMFSRYRQSLGKAGLQTRSKSA